VVRNLLLDWVTDGLGEAGPEAVARMIKLEVKQAQVFPAPAAVSQPETLALPAKAVARVITFSVLVAPPTALSCWCRMRTGERRWKKTTAWPSASPAASPS